MKRPKILVLGAGLVGTEIARCLSEKAEVTVVDRSPKTLASLASLAAQNSSRQTRLQLWPGNFLDTKQMLGLASSHDVVVGAIEPSIAYAVLTQIAQAGTPIVDISFYEEPPLSLDPVAKHNSIPIVVDCGVVPGLSNMLLGRETELMAVESFVIQCGGLPAKPEPPWYYKAPFSPRSVIDLYTREAAFVENGDMLKVDPLETITEVCLSEYPKLGELTPLVSIKTNGLRTLLDTQDVPNMVDQTLRYSAHMRLMQDFIKSRFFLDEPVSVKTCGGKDVEVARRVFSEKVLATEWKLGEDEDEFTVFVVRMKGVAMGEIREVTYHTLVRRDPKTHATSMSRITGYPCAAVALLLARGDITKAGIITPEEMGGNERLAKFIFDFMEERGISLTKVVNK